MSAGGYSETPKKEVGVILKSLKMKNLICLLFVFLFAIIACENDNPSNPYDLSVNNTFDPCIIGDFHNYALDRLILEVPTNVSASSPEIGMDLMRNIYNVSLDEYSDDFELEPVYVANEVLLEVVSEEFRDISDVAIQEDIEILENNGLISEEESSLMFNAYKAAGNLNALEVLKVEWESKNYDLSKSEGSISLATICLAISSTEYWNSYNHNEETAIVRLSPAHADVGGFIVGAALGGLSGDDISTSMGKGIVTAVVASSGIAGRIGRWLFK